MSAASYRPHYGNRRENDTDYVTKPSAPENCRTGSTEKLDTAGVYQILDMTILIASVTTTDLL